MNIHPTAVVSKDAKLGKNVEVGPYAVIESDVTIGDNCFIGDRVKIARYTTVGDNCRFYLGALAGEEPQDHRFRKGIVSYTEIGSNVVVREYVTIHRPPFENQKTVVGDGCLLMGFVHVAHDVKLGRHVTIANHTAITGHVEIEDYAILSGYIKIHQFCRIGTLAFVGAGVILTQDVPPYCMLRENGFICGPNTIGLRRANIDSELRLKIRNAIKTFFFQGLNAKNALSEIDAADPLPEIAHFSEFIKASKRGIMPGNPKFAHNPDGCPD